MAVLHIHYADVSADYALDTHLDLTDADLRRIAVDFVRRIVGRSVPGDAFDQHAVDRFTSSRGERRITLVPLPDLGGPRSA